MKTSYIKIPLSKLLPSPAQPKDRDMGDLDGLAATIASLGLIHPLSVRPAEEKGFFYITAGHRRFYALALLKETHAQCILEERTEERATAALIAENAHRQAFRPLQEAELIQSIKSRGEDIETVAKQIGLSTNTARRRLKLLQLCPEAQEALNKGQIRLGVAETLALTMSHANQKLTLRELLRGSEEGGFDPLSPNVANGDIRRYQPKLISAPFALDDATLHGGACSQCPKRILAQGYLFDDPVEEDRCLDFACFEKKRADQIAAPPPPPRVQVSDASDEDPEPEKEAPRAPSKKDAIAKAKKTAREKAIEVVGKKMASSRRDLADAGLWRTLASAVLAIAYGETSPTIKRRGLGDSLEKALEAVSELKSARDGAAFACELLAEFGEIGGLEPSPLAMFAEYLKIDVEKMEAVAVAAVRGE